MNYEMNDPFPEPPDPTIPDMLLGNGSFMDDLRKSRFTHLIKL